MLQIGLNATIFANKSSLNNEIGQKAAAVLRAIREFDQLATVIDAFSNDEIKTLSFGDGNGNPATPNEIGYGVRDPAVCAHDMMKLLTGQTPSLQAGTDYRAKLRYVSGSQG